MLTDYQENLNGFYDRFFQENSLYLGEGANSGYANLGLFLEDTTDFGAACDNMMALVVSKLKHHDGPLLDVGCGMGGTTAYLHRRFPERDIYGINVSEYQIDRCRERAPKANFEVMPAEQMRFPDAMFTSVVSIEAALHFRGRVEFLREAQRALKPGGEIVVADLIFREEPTSFRRVLAGQECYSDLDSYRKVWIAAGFDDLMIEDITQASWRAFTEHYKKAALRGLLQKRIAAAEFKRNLEFISDIEQLPILAYVVASAKKPVNKKSSK